MTPFMGEDHMCPESVAADNEDRLHIALHQDHRWRLQTGRDDIEIVFCPWCGVRL